jgi:cysteine-rich repeat protein
MAEQQEECDDGNRVNTDGCSNVCTGNICGNNRLDPGEACDGPQTADGKPIPDGYLCEKNCAGIKNDSACRECERRVCSDYQGAGYDLPKYCYDEVPEEGKGGIGDFNKKCTALIRCIQQNACDVNTGLAEPEPIKCYCGKDTSIDECFGQANHQFGPCIPEYEAATGSVKGDYMNVSNNGVALSTPAGVASFLAKCQADVDCRSVCR